MDLFGLESYGKGIYSVNLFVAGVTKAKNHYR